MSISGKPTLDETWPRVDLRLSSYLVNRLITKLVNQPDFFRFYLLNPQNVGIQFQDND